MTVARASILRHLLDEPSDPFTRVPLQAEQLEENEELRARIDRWRAERTIARGHLDRRL